MKYNYLLLLVLLFAVTQIYCQSDTIVVYDVENQMLTEIPPVLFDTLIVFDHSAHSFGYMDKAELSLTPPNSNLYEGTEFMRLERAELFFEISNYPISTATKLINYTQDSISWGCSGIMVSENLVLTAAHCIIDHHGNWYADSILVATGFDNGEFHDELPSSIVSKYYLFKSYYNSHSSMDFALLELEKPIGKKTGWIGMAFASDTSFFSDKVFHKFSYPRDATYVDTSIHVNGDTLYYNYGKIEVLNEQFIGLNSDEARLIPGQSGSSLFFTDNTDYFSLGIAIFSRAYGHFRISNEVFYQFKNVLDNYTGTSIVSIDFKEELRIYPNPFIDNTTVEFDNYRQRNFTISIYDIMGKMIRREMTASNKYQIERGDLKGGIYHVVLSSSQGFVSKSVVIVN